MKFSAATRETESKSLEKKALAPIVRYSNGFDQFSSVLQKSNGLSILDMSGASQANVSFITGLGHRISTDDILGTMEQCFGADFLENEKTASKAQRFLDQTLTFAEESFDGALVWDTFQFLASPLLDQAIAQLLRVMRPSGLMLFFFGADEKATRMPTYNYRIQDHRTLLLSPRGTYQNVHFFHNRLLERLFHGASSVKFFLTRDNLRELIVRR
ncbi:MAG: class I SAM-dependent methyltransferase [Acidobacteriaceae bacterium]|nr:class I SAM-dependent methyltransferase [Acidobacteriaceae bacterium]MBV9778995.1 class I SAM-dependent methyltransferase [Acidobacteriaceae bacterium]